MRYNFCPNCGCKLEANYRFCPNCGMEIGGHEKVEHQEIMARTLNENKHSNQPTNSSLLDNARNLFANRDYTGALACLVGLADSGDLEVSYMIGQCLYMTKKLDPSCEHFLKLAADQGHPLAQASLGELYYTLAEKCETEDPNDPRSNDKEMYYSLALEYLNKAKKNGVK